MHSTASIEEIRLHRLNPLSAVLHQGHVTLRTLQTRRQIRERVTRPKPLQVELGAGAKAGSDGWVTLDRHTGSDLCWDLRKGIPFPDGSVDSLYSSHMLEHLQFSETQALLKEALRVLRSEGTFSVCVPNARLYLEAYVGIRELDSNKFFGYEPAYNHTTKIDVVNYTAYMAGEHKYMWDEDNLTHVLDRAGFRNVSLREFDPHLDMAERDHESIYAIGTK